MLNADYINEIKQIIEDFFSKASFNVQVEVLPFNDKTIPVRIKTEDSNILIGQNGQTLGEIQYLLKLILKRKLIDKEFYVDLDINGYKQEKIEYLREMAKSAADEVSLLHQNKIFPPMSSYERRIIHMELTGRDDVLAESIGEEPERKIIIKPKI